MRFVARELGAPLMDWQALVADVANEVDDEGRPAYREVIVSVPRQSGKTLLLLVHELERAIFRKRPHRIFYSAQTGWDARRKLIDDQVPMLQASPLWERVDKVQRQSGNEALLFKNGSRIDVMASTSSAGHGRTMDMGVIDEAFDDSDNRREQAMIPAMATKKGAQLWVVSTAGTESSTYLRRKIESGRAMAKAGRTDSIAYFEWSAPEDADPDDPATWRACMPALGETISEQAVRHARDSMSDGEFRRAYLNQWVSGKEETVIPFDLWERACDPSVAVDPPRAFAVSTTLERDWTTVAVSDGLRVEVADHRSGVGWAGDWLVERAVKWRAPVAVDKAGPAGSLIPVLERAGVEVVEVGATEVARAAVGFHDRVVDGTVRVRQEGVLDAALANARKRPISSSWGFGRRTQDVPITPLEAVALAVWAAGDDAAPQLRVIDLSSL